MDNEETRPDQCLRCGSRHLMRDLPVGTDATSERVQVAAVPRILLRPTRGIASVQATVCGDCGHTEFHTAEYAQMWEVWRKHYA